MKKILFISILFISLTKLSFSQNTETTASQILDINFSLEEQIAGDYYEYSLGDIYQVVDTNMINFATNFESVYNESYIRCPRPFLAANTSEETIVNKLYILSDEERVLIELNTSYFTMKTL